MAPLLILHGTLLSNGKGSKRDKVEPSRSERGHRRRRKEEEDGVFKPSSPPHNTPHIKADPPLGRFVRQPCNR